MDSLLNTTLGQYKVIDIVGRGGMSTIFKGYQETLDRFVAIKVLPYTHDPQFTLRFKREARAIAHLQHPNILPIYDYGEQNGLLYLVFQYIPDSATVQRLLGSPMDPVRALRLISRVLDGLGYAHERGIIHRDIKPANILLSAPDWPMLADFGIAKLRDDSQRLTVPGLIVGTAAYMAPEQASGQTIDARTDLYSTGVVLYELLTGRVPFDSETPVALLAKHVHEPPPLPRTIVQTMPSAVESLLLKTLAKDPADRFQSAEEMQAECLRLAHWLEQSTAQFDGPAAPAAPPTRPLVMQQPATYPAPAPRPAAAPVPAAPVPVAVPPASPSPAVDTPAAPTGGNRWLLPVIGGVILLVALVGGFLFLRGRGDTGGTATNPTAPPVATTAANAATSAPQAATQPPADATQPPAATPAATPVPVDPPPDPTGTLAFQDAFEGGNDASGLIGAFTPDNVSIAADNADGALVMQPSAPNTSAWRLMPHMIADNFNLEFDLSDGSAAFDGNAAQGVVFRARDMAHFYALLIDARGGRYTLRRYDAANNFTDLVPWTESGFVAREGAVNAVRLDAQANTFTFYVNGSKLGTASDNTYASGMLGTLVENTDAASPRLRFDNLKIWTSREPLSPASLPATQPGQRNSGDMVLVRGGEFVLGSNDDGEHLPHVFELPDFYIDRTEVTNIAYGACTDQYGCQLPGNLGSATQQNYLYEPKFQFYPVLNVTWKEAQAYCETVGKRLPSEAEWEKAASWNTSTGAKTIWPWGNEFDPGRANTTEAKRGDTTQVGTFAAGNNNAVDMAGNVAEWTNSLDAPYPYANDERESATASGNRVVRGGSWQQPANESTATSRGALDPSTVSPAIGFRCVANP